MEKELDRPFLVAQIAHDDFANVDVAIDVDGVIAPQAQSHLDVLARDVGDERVTQIRELFAPRRVFDPPQFAVGEDAEAKSRRGMVLHPDVRIVEIGKAILRIESDEKTAVTDDEVAWHCSI